MLETPYLLFNIRDTRYGIETLAVEEIVSLPALTPIPEVPPDIIGVVNIRGEIVPIVDIHLRLPGYHPDYYLTDAVIILKLDALRLGIVVSQVHEVRLINDEEVTKELSLGKGWQRTEIRHFTQGIARSQQDLLILLKVESLVNYIKSQDILLTPIQDHNVDRPTLDQQQFSYSQWWSNLTPNDQEIFNKRANNLRLTTEGEDQQGLKPLAVVALAGESFGIDLLCIREFTDIKKVTVIPCCPSHILGNMNLRGEILTLVSIHQLLNLPPSGIDEGKVMVTQIGEIVVGVVVDEVKDVFFYNPQNATPIPTALSSNNEEFLKGEISYQNGLLSLLDLAKVFTKGGLEVDE